MSEAHIHPDQKVYKFDSCRHRSAEPISKVVRRCSCQGGDYEDKGFFCNRRSIFKIDRNFCEYCELYESK